MPRLLRFQPGGVGQHFDAPMVVENGRAVMLGKLVRENHESTCGHCQHITAFPSKREMMNYVEICRGCFRLICLTCYDRMCKGIEGCVPAEERILQEERAAELAAKIERDRWRCY